VRARMVAEEAWIAASKDRLREEDKKQAECQASVACARNGARSRLPAAGMPRSAIQAGAEEAH
jgi:hypothetical protein